MKETPQERFERRFNERQQRKFIERGRRMSERLAGMLGEKPKHGHAVAMTSELEGGGGRIRARTTRSGGHVSAKGHGADEYG